MPKIEAVTASKPKLSSADQAASQKITMTQAAVPRAQAEKEFQTKYAARYPSTFESEPKSRPKYVPQSTTVGGSNYVVIYDPIHRGYGYYRGGSWYAYDALHDAAMLSVLMDRRPVVYSGDSVVVQEGPGGYTVFVVIIVLVGIGCALYLFTRKI